MLSLETLFTRSRSVDDRVTVIRENAILWTGRYVSDKRRTVTSVKRYAAAIRHFSALDMAMASASSPPEEAPFLTTSPTPTPINSAPAMAARSGLPDRSGKR